MTSRQIYEAVLIEMNKVDAPSLLLEDFNYLFNKAINQYINKRYNVYDINQQTTDDLRVLKSTAILTPEKVMSQDGDQLYYNGQAIASNDVTAINSLYGATYSAYLPTDYLHILNCICVFKCKKRNRCYDENSYYPFAALRLTSDAWPVVINNLYQRPSYKRPYYFIHNVNTSNEIPTNPYVSGELLGKGTDPSIQEIKNHQAALLEYNTYLEELNQFNTVISQLTAKINTALQNPPPETTVEQEGSEGPKYVTIDGNNYYLHAFILNPKTNPQPIVAWLSSSQNAIQFDSNGTPKMNSYYTSETTFEITNVMLLGSTTGGIPGQYKTVLPPSKVEKPEATSSKLSLSRTLDLSDGTSLDLVEKTAGIRYGNTSPVRIEIRYGKDSSVFELAMIHVDYIKTPQYICLTPEQIDLDEDTSQVMEFPDYVCQEIINELVHIVMENASDPRLQSHPIVSQSIAPAQQQAAQPSA